MKQKQSIASESFKIKFTDELHNHLVDVVEARVRLNEAKGKKAKLIQQEVFIGACTAIDFINGEIKDGGRGCITPGIWWSIVNGEKIEKIEKGGKVN